MATIRDCFLVDEIISDANIIFCKCTTSILAEFDSYLPSYIITSPPVGEIGIMYASDIGEVLKNILIKKARILNMPLPRAKVIY